eukprot:2210522-Rhodomonas_salina.1
MRVPDIVWEAGTGHRIGQYRTWRTATSRYAMKGARRSGAHRGKAERMRLRSWMLEEGITVAAYARSVPDIA